MGLVDVSGKDIVPRRAVARGSITLESATLEAIREGRIKKGDVLTVAEAAGLLAIKNVPSTIPHCHPLPISHASVVFEMGDASIVCDCTVKAEYRTGVEVEALAGVMTALLTVWDMVKYLEKDDSGQYPGTRITDVHVVTKEKGASS